MTSTQSESWPGLALRGVAALAFGILTLVWPGITLTALVVLVGAFLLVDGIGVLVAVASGDRAPGSRWGLALVQGIAGVVAGILTFIWPGITALALLYLIAAWAVVTGALEVAAAVSLRKLIENEWALVARGVLSVLFGVLLAVFPGAGALALTWLIGAFAIVYGVVALGQAIGRWRETHAGAASGPTRRATA
jgi:uncharacterized membrane protein HdeD (DUF308 family)